jgi:hypothetical protein
MNQPLIQTMSFIRINLMKGCIVVHQIKPIFHKFRNILNSLLIVILYVKNRDVFIFQVGSAHFQGAEDISY